MSLKNYEFWFVVGSQFLYGPEVLETVAARAQEMVDELNASGTLPCKVVYKVTAKTNKEITDVVREANYDKKCAGIITWCHTFSPSKMWINGFVDLQKPYGAYSLNHLPKSASYIKSETPVNMWFIRIRRSLQPT